MAMMKILGQWLALFPAAASPKLDCSFYASGELWANKSPDPSVCIFSLFLAASAACQGANMTSIETGQSGRINDVCVIRDSGLLIAAVDAPRMEAFFVPALGPAPAWCSFLENITVSQMRL